ncbi:MAG TPA: hypothetical protein VF236_08405 [Gaiellaceae bacterium]
MLVDDGDPVLLPNRDPLRGDGVGRRRVIALAKDRADRRCATDVLAFLGAAADPDEPRAVVEDEELAVTVEVVVGEMESTPWGRRSSITG